VVQKYVTYALVGNSFLWHMILRSAMFQRKATAFILKVIDSIQEFTIGTLDPRKWC